MKRTMKTLKVNDIFPIRTGGTVTVTKLINNLNIGVTHNDTYRYRHPVYMRFSCFFVVSYLNYFKYILL